MKALKFFNIFFDAQQGFEGACRGAEEFDRKLKKKLDEEEEGFGIGRGFEEVGRFMREAISKLGLDRS